MWAQGDGGLMAERKHEGRVAGAGMLWPASCCFGALIAALVVAIHRTGRDGARGGAGCVEAVCGCVLCGPSGVRGRPRAVLCSRRIRSFFGLSPAAPGDWRHRRSRRCCRVAGAASDVCWRGLPRALARRCCFSPGSTGSPGAPWPSVSSARAWHSRRRLWPALCCSTCRRRLCRSW